MPPAIHPGEFLAEILQAFALSQAEFARRIGVSPMRVSHVIKGARPVTAELACRFGQAFGQTPQYWLNLQADFDIKSARRRLAPEIKRTARIDQITLAARLDSIAGDLAGMAQPGRRNVSQNEVDALWGHA